MDQQDSRCFRAPASPPSSAAGGISMGLYLRISYIKGQASPEQGSPVKSTAVRPGRPMCSER
jgi:hypothetical protein